MSLQELIEHLLEYRGNLGGKVEVDVDDSDGRTYYIKGFTVFEGVGANGADMLTIDVG